MLFSLLPRQTAFTFMPRLSPRTALLSMRPDAALAHVFISFAPDGFIFTPSYPCCTLGLYCHLYRKLRTGEESGNARQRHFLTILFCFYNIMLVIVFCERVFYAIVTPIGRNFAYRKSKKLHSGAPFVSARLLCKNGKICRRNNAKKGEFTRAVEYRK